MIKNTIWISLLVLLSSFSTSSGEKINLALRRTADLLLRAEGDSTSRIPTIENPQHNVYRIRLHQSFDYEKLPKILQSSLDQYAITSKYEVYIKNCNGDSIDLGYNYLDLLIGEQVPCSGRVLPEGCRYIEVTFSDVKSTNLSWWFMTTFILAGVSGFVYHSNAKKSNFQDGIEKTVFEKPLLSFGFSKLDIDGQILYTDTEKHALTYRETKLLALFGNNLNQLLDREFIIQKVWGDEGVMVGRSVDVFVSRLRKKLSSDPSLQIMGVHGIGYRLEFRKNENEGIEDTFN